MSVNGRGLSTALSLLGRLQRDETDTLERLKHIRVELDAVRRTMVLLEQETENVQSALEEKPLR